MKRPKTIMFSEETFSQAADSFDVVTIAFSKELEHLDESSGIPRWNSIKIHLKRIGAYSEEILFLKVLRTGSVLQQKNFYSFPLVLDRIRDSGVYEIVFLHFDAFNEEFETIEVSVISRKEYAERLLNENAVERARAELKSVRRIA